jgi:hypothetical protein
MGNIGRQRIARRKGEDDSQGASLLSAVTFQAAFLSVEMVSLSGSAARGCPRALKQGHSFLLAWLAGNIAQQTPRD